MPIKALGNIHVEAGDRISRTGGDRWVRVTDPDGRIHCREENSEDR